MCCIAKGCKIPLKINNIELGAFKSAIQGTNFFSRSSHTFHTQLIGSISIPRPSKGPTLCSYWAKANRPHQYLPNPNHTHS